VITHRHPFVATAQLLAGAALLFCVWRMLPTRYAPVDVGGTALGALLGASSIGLYVGRPWGRWLGIAAAATTLALGLLTVLALAFAAGELFGLYGPVGQGGAVILGLVAALLFAYFVALPGLWLVALAPPART
jgi:hypothetical protein